MDNHSLRADLKFPTRKMAERFITLWGKYSLRGNSMSSGHTNVTVTLYDVSDSDKNWIEQTCKELNNSIK